MLQRHAKLQILSVWVAFNLKLAFILQLNQYMNIILTVDVKDKSKF